MSRRPWKRIGMSKRYVVRLTGEERASLQRLVSVGKTAARRILHAQVLLQADECSDGPGWPDRQISQALSVHHYRCPDQAQKTLPTNPTVILYYNVFLMSRPSASGLNASKDHFC